MNPIANIIRKSSTFQEALQDQQIDFDLERTHIRKKMDDITLRLNQLDKVSRLRSFQAGISNRLNANWSTAASSIDQDIRSGLAAVRARARDLVQNNDYAKNYIKELQANIVGANGFKLQSNVRLPAVAGKRPKSDSVTNLTIQDGFKEWCKPENCSNNGRFSFRAICELLITYAGRDGEFIVRKRSNKKSKFGFQLQIIPPEALDEKYNARLQNGNVVKMGVELDIERRPVAYHIIKAKPEQELYGFPFSSRDLERVPAEEIIHSFDQQYENQTRGISWMVQSMSRLKMLSTYEENELIASAVAAAQGGFFYNEKDTAGEMKFDGKDAQGNDIMEIEPGILRDIGDKRFQAFEPKHPTNQYGTFTKDQLRGASAGLELAYSSLSNDLSDANYGSQRQGMQKEREKFKRTQQWFVEAFLDKIYTEWLEWAIISGQLGNLRMSKLQEYNKGVWIGRRWGWIDPLKDAAATVIRLKSGLTSHYQVLGEEGEDPEEVFEDIAEIQQLAKEKGITIDLDGIQIGVTMNEGNPQQPQNANDQVEENAIIAFAKRLLNTRKNGHDKTEPSHAAAANES